MRKVVFIVVCLVVAAVTANAQQKKTWYKQADIEGMWLVTELYNENTKQWESTSAEAYAFSNVTSDGMKIALFGESGQENLSRGVYTFANNKIRIYDINRRDLLLYTIKIVSMKRGQSFIGELYLLDTHLCLKYRFTRIDEKED